MNESPNLGNSISRKDRLINLIVRLRDGELHRAIDLARETNVSDRTLYRDMATLKQSGVPVLGTRGAGYYMTAPVTLPPLNLTLAELEALNLGLAAVCATPDPDLQHNARTLAAKIDAALPEDGRSQTTGWGLAVFPFADTASGVHQVPKIRQAIRTRHKLRLEFRTENGEIAQSVVQPLKLEYWGRVWTTTVWSEPDNAPILLRVDQISVVTELAEIF